MPVQFYTLVYENKKQKKIEITFVKGEIIAGEYSSTVQGVVDVYQLDPGQMVYLQRVIQVISVVEIG